MSPADWHALSKEESLNRLKIDIQGLSSEEASRRLQKYGKNELQKYRKKSKLEILVGQLQDPMIVVLAVATVISLFLKEFTDAFIIILIVILNTLIGFYQESKAEIAMEALRTYSPQKAKVYRDGSFKIIDASELVPGDIVLIEAGDIVPADLRLVKVNNLKVDESILTGESHPVTKDPDITLEKMISIADRINMAFKGTTVVSGSAKGTVVATGSQTELGKIATLAIETKAEKTPLQKRLADFSKKISLIVILISVFLFVAGLLRGGDIYEIFLTSVSLAVAAVPEALPAVASIALAIGASEMAKRNALIRHLPAVETLGSTTFICTDKTGTLTLNQMIVEGFKFAEDRELLKTLPEDSRAELLKLNILNNHECHLLDDGKISGDPTEIALLRALGVLSSAEKDEENRFTLLPFDSKRKMMSVGVKVDGRKYLFTKGSPEEILKKSTHYISSDGTVKPIAEIIDKIEEDLEELAISGYRTLGFAYKIIEDDDIEEDNLIFTGLSAIIDPPRPEVKQSIEECYQAGIKVAMITGDHPATAKKIAEEVGIKPVKMMLTGRELYEMSMKDYERIVEDVTVYARVDPEQKLKIVNALKDKNHIVAMTGDGVNDAPALKRADIGVAMGVTGTEVARESADMILLDDNFSTIVKAVKEGRRIYENIRKFIKYTMGSNTGEVISIVLAPVIGLPIPIKPVHILWINLVTDGLPGLALSYEDAEPDTMQRPPRPVDESIFARGLGWHIIWVGILLGLLTLLSLQLAFRFGWSKEATTIAFSVLCLSQLGHSLAIRSDKYSSFQLGFFKNRMLIFSVLLTLILQLLIIYLPLLNSVFKTQPLNLVQLMFVLVASTIVFISVEIEKFLIRKYDIYSRIKNSINEI